MKSEQNRKKRDQLFLKIKLYVISLWLLFALIFLLTAKWPFYFDKGVKFIGWLEFIKQDWLAILSLLMAIIGLCFTSTIKRKWTGTANPSVEILSLKSENYEYLTFLTTYIIPLICIDLNEIRYVVVLGVLLILIGYIFVRMDLYYGNPTLALMGFRLYRAEIKGYDSPNGIVLICKDRLVKGKSIKWIVVDENVWLAKEIKK